MHSAWGSVQEAPVRFPDIWPEGRRSKRSCAGWTAYRRYNDERSRQNAEPAARKLLRSAGKILHGIRPGRNRDLESPAGKAGEELLIFSGFILFLKNKHKGMRRKTVLLMPLSPAASVPRQRKTPDASGRFLMTKVCHFLCICRPAGYF